VLKVQISKIDLTKTNKENDMGGPLQLPFSHADRHLLVLEWPKRRQKPHVFSGLGILFYPKRHSNLGQEKDQ